TMNIGPIWRLTPPERLSPAKPECCEALWEDKSTLTTNTGLDPILFTDQHTGRTFASNSTVGANAVYAYSDNDGDSWIEAGFSPPDGGADPSIAIDSNNTAYFCYVNNEPVAPNNPPEGHVHVKVSTDGGQTWIRDVDVGASHGITNAAHTEAVGGSAGRAACGFIGTDR